MRNRIYAAILTALLIMAAVSAMAGTAAADLPATFDWRDVNGTNYVSPLTDQEDCGSCYAFAATAAFEMFVSTHGGPILDLSENQCKACSGFGCSGGVPAWVLGMFSIVGSVSEEDDPYVPWDTTCEQNTPVVRVTGWKCLSYGSRDEIKSYIYEYGHVIASPAHHSLIVIGWNDTKPTMGTIGAWIVKNSQNYTGYEGGEFAYYPYGLKGMDDHVISITGYEDHDEDTRTVANVDKANQGVGFDPDKSAWGLSMLEVFAGEKITKIEFDTTGSTSDIDLYIYDSFDGSSLGNLLYQVTNLSYDAEGMYSVDVSTPLFFDCNTEVALVGHFTNIGTAPNMNGFCPIATDTSAYCGKTYISQTGANGSWSGYADEATLRLRAETRECGDVDPNKGLDARDVTYLAKHVAGISGYETLHGNGDVDLNEGLDARDVTYLAKHVAGISGYETLYC